MATLKPKTGTQQRAASAARAAAPAPWPFNRTNYIWLGVALGVIIIGFVLLGSGSITLAPLLLVIGYCVLIPVALKNFEKPSNSNPLEKTPQ